MAAIVDQMLDLDPLARPTPGEAKAALGELFRNVGDEKHSFSIFYTN
jgi:hypothetical protein